MKKETIKLRAEWFSHRHRHFCDCSVAGGHLQLAHSLPGLLHGLPGKHRGQESATLAPNDVEDRPEGSTSNSPASFWQWAGLPPLTFICEVKHFCTVQGAGRGVAPSILDPTNQKESSWCDSASVQVPFHQLFCHALSTKRRQWSSWQMIGTPLTRSRVPASTSSGRSGRQQEGWFGAHNSADLEAFNWPVPPTTNKPMLSYTATTRDGKENKRGRIISLGLFAYSRGTTAYTPLQ